MFKHYSLFSLSNRVSIGICTTSMNSATRKTHKGIKMVGSIRSLNHQYYASSLVIAEHRHNKQVSIIKWYIKTPEDKEMFEYTLYTPIQVFIKNIPPSSVVTVKKFVRAR